MPKLPVDYSKTCIYKLFHNDDINDENIYIGHTTNIVKRRYQHKSACCNINSKEYNIKRYKYIRENGGWYNWRMILVEKYPCNDVDEAKARERYWIKELKATLNSNEPCRTYKEWREDNKELIAEKSKEWRENNKELIAEKKKEWRENNKQQIVEKKKEYRENNKELIKERKQNYYQDNKEQIIEKVRLYSEKNKQQIAEKSKEKITCECGCTLRKDNLKRHIKSQQHQEYLKKNLPII